MKCSFVERLRVRRVGEITYYAVDERDLVDVLKRLGLYHDVVEGRGRCYFCGVPVGLENLGGVFRYEGKAYLVCNSVRCLYEAAWMIARKRQ